MYKPKVSVIISYNPVEGFNSGWHGNGKLFICASDAGWGAKVGQGKNNYEKASSVMHQISHQYYDGQVPIENVNHYYIYAGLYAFKSAISLAKELKQKSSAPVSVVACSCKLSEKKELLSDQQIPLINCECGGKSYLGKLAHKILNQG